MEFDSLDHAEDRCNTFDSLTWPHKFITPLDLAEAGFYYVGPQHDKVKCYRCGIFMSKWKKGDSVTREHKKWSPFCPFLMNSELNRLETFKKWKRSDINFENLAKTGLFCVGVDDSVQCNFCDVVLFDWEKDDNEIFEHQRLSPSCEFLKHHELTQNIPLDPSNKQLNDLLAPVKYICNAVKSMDYRYMSIDKLEKKYYTVQKATLVEIDGVQCVRVDLPEKRIIIMSLRHYDDYYIDHLRELFEKADLENDSFTIMKLYCVNGKNKFLFYRSRKEPLYYQASEPVAVEKLKYPTQVLLFSTVEINNEKRIRVNVRNNRHFILPNLKYAIKDVDKIENLECWNKMRWTVHYHNSMLVFLPEENTRFTINK